MKIYLAGPISGLPYGEVEKRFEEAEALLSARGYSVVSPLKSGLASAYTPEERIAREVALLLSCRAVYFMSGWQQSLRASIGYEIALKSGKEILFETVHTGSREPLKAISRAVHEATGVSPAEYSKKGRRRKAFFARVLLAHYATEADIRAAELADFLHRTHDSIAYYLKTYRSENRYNPHFRKLAERVEALLKAPLSI